MIESIHNIPTRHYYDIGDKTIIYLSSAEEENKKSNIKVFDRQRKLVLIRYRFTL